MLRKTTDKLNQITQNINSGSRGSSEPQNIQNGINNDPEYLDEIIKTEPSFYQNAKNKANKYYEKTKNIIYNNTVASVKNGAIPIVDPIFRAAVYRPITKASSSKEEWENNPYSKSLFPVEKGYRATGPSSSNYNNNKSTSMIGGKRKSRSKKNKKNKTKKNRKTKK
jgi:hypothetical protein